jgi:hypothetical protein
VTRRLKVPTLGPTDWRRLLADPSKQWKPGKSAWESAVAWEAARSTDSGLPPEIAAIFATHPDAFPNPVLLLGLPEHKVQLDGGGHASQNDLWALIRTARDVVSVAIEAKAGEAFGPIVADWLVPQSEGKEKRLHQLCDLLGLVESAAYPLRYQLLHRAGSAILEARRFHLGRAVLLVHAFGNNTASWNDYSAWAAALRVTAQPGVLQQAQVRSSVTPTVEFWMGWVDAPFADATNMRDAI